MHWYIGIRSLRRHLPSTMGHSPYPHTTPRRKFKNSLKSPSGSRTPRCLRNILFLGPRYRWAVYLGRNRKIVCCPFQLSIDPSFITTSLHPQPLRGAPISIIKRPFLSVCNKALLVSSLVTVEYPRLNVILFYSRKVGTQDC